MYNNILSEILDTTSEMKTTLHYHTLDRKLLKEFPFIHYPQHGMH